MRSRRLHERVTGWLGVVAVLSNVLASVLCLAPAKAIAPIDDILGPLDLCTDHGPAPVLGDTGSDQRDGKSKPCTACTLLAGLALLVGLIFATIAFPVRIFYPSGAPPARWPII